MKQENGTPLLSSASARSIETAKDLLKGALPGVFKLFRRIKYGKPRNDQDDSGEPQRISETFSDEKLEESAKEPHNFLRS